MPLFSSSKSKDKRRLMVVSHTHWDREWYLPYQSFRVRLVGLFDQLIELFDSDPEYKHFMLDGHTIPLEDYLEIRPDRFDDIERLVQEGKLLIGPWYIIPDEALPGGEALIRNFLRGHRVAQLFGPVMKVGYIPDPFGQIAHMPAILRGFGIEQATMWRGTDDSLKTTEFFWRSPDGSEVLTIHKPHGYGNAGTLPATRRRADVAHPGRARRPGAAGDDALPAADERQRPPAAPAGAIVDAADGNAELIGCHDRALHRCPRSSTASVNTSATAAREWPRHEGEFRSGQRAHLLPGVLSARMWIKQSNQECEDLLAHWAEPFSTWADMLKKQVGPEWSEPLPPTTAHMPFPTSEESIAALIDRAWRHLLENQPHDSICGCSVDAVHEEMRQRYDWVREIGEEIVRQSPAHDRRARPARRDGHDRRLQPDAAAGDVIRHDRRPVERRAADHVAARPRRFDDRRAYRSATRSTSSSPMARPPATTARAPRSASLRPMYPVTDTRSIACRSPTAPRPNRRRHRAHSLRTIPSRSRRMHLTVR